MDYTIVVNTDETPANSGFIEGEVIQSAFVFDVVLPFGFTIENLIYYQLAN